MNINCSYNLLDIDKLINEFYLKYKQGITTIHRHYYHNSDDLAIRSLIEELRDELRTGCVSFINKNNSTDELDSYLFYIVNDFCKKNSIPQNKRKTEYLCPGCLFLGKENILSGNNYLNCNNCEHQLSQLKDPKKILFYKTFFKHNKNGYRCTDCERFIPHPIDNSKNISCPYFDCYFNGDYSSLRKMHHPNSQSNIEHLTLDINHINGKSFKDLIVSDSVDALSQLEIEEKLKEKISLLKEVIESQYNNILYSGSEFTAHFKRLIYQSFLNNLDKNPVEMISYLLENSRSGGFQHKIFQEYIRLLEESLPLTLKKNNQVIKIDSLLSDHLGLFEGISIFESFVTKNFSIKNETKEFYIGGRKGYVTQPYYIGKLLSLTDKKTKMPLMKNVLEYTFNKIKVNNIAPNTAVIVTHLRVPPHYQMGGMTYVNRIRKKIVERAKLISLKQ